MLELQASEPTGGVMDASIGTIIEGIVRGVIGTAMVFGLAAIAGAGIGMFLRTIVPPSDRPGRAPNEH